MSQVPRAALAIVIDAGIALLGSVGVLAICPVLAKVGIQYGGDKAPVVLPALFGGPLGVLIYRLADRRCESSRLLGIGTGVVLGVAAGAVTVIGLTAIGPLVLLANPVLVAGAFRIGETLVGAIVGGHGCEHSRQP